MLEHVPVGVDDAGGGDGEGGIAASSGARAEAPGEGNTPSPGEPTIARLRGTPPPKDSGERG